MRIASLCLLLCIVTNVFAQVTKAPAYPLITHDPYFSIWSFTDELNTSSTKHWTGADHSIQGIIKVDGKNYRFLGAEEKAYETLLASADEKSYQCKYTEDQPADGWMNKAFNDAGWKITEAPFSSRKREAKTLWKSKNLWIRRSFVVNEVKPDKLFLKLHHDDNVEVYLNGALIYTCDCWNGKAEFFPMTDEIKSKLVKGENILAIHCANTAGGAYLDAGLSFEKRSKTRDEISNAIQKTVEVKATQTVYGFTCGGVDLSLTFSSPLIMNNLDLLSRPVSYVTMNVKSNDGKEHDARL